MSFAENKHGSRWRKRPTRRKTTQAIKLFSELKTPVEVAIALDLSADRVRAIYREYWELEGMYGLVQIYENNTIPFV